MLILAIDTSTRAGSIAILRDGKVLLEISAREDTPYSERLFRDLALLRSRAKFELGDVDIFATTTGPGSFTGLRVGLTAVKAWAEVYRKPIAAISCLEAIATQAQAPVSMVAAFLDARRGLVFGATYHRDILESRAPLQLVGEEAILSVEEFLMMVKANSVNEQIVLVSPTMDALTAENVNLVLPGARIETVSASLAPFVGLLGFERADCGALTDALNLDANYVRRPDAEQFRKGG